VRTDSEQCPHCHQDLDPDQVWKTRKYSGQVILPHWVTAFGWPLGLIVLGLAISGGVWAIGGGLQMIKIAASVLGFGLVMFFIKLTIDHDE
jgi:hypothetical protein